MLAATVIPAPIPYIKVVAVKKLVVGFRGSLTGQQQGEHCSADIFSKAPTALKCSGRGVRGV